MMDKYKVVFVVGGSDKTVWPAAVLRDARARKINAHLGRVWAGCLFG